MSSPGPDRGVLSPGQILGPYRIERMLGRGGMGEVFEAQHLENGHWLALKVLPPGPMQLPPRRERFLREGLLAASFNHPNSLYVYGTAEIGGIPIIAMELAPGGTLKDRVESAGPLPVTEAVRAILQIISGLEAAQRAGILHRDIKPANCFLDRDGQVKIGDYGLALPTSDAETTCLTKTGSALGTPAFASPEQIRGQTLDVRSDIYAVGATLHFLLTGQTPFTAPGPPQMLAAILERTPRSPRLLRKEIPAGLANVVLRCLKKESSQRFQNYAELSDALAAFGPEGPPAAGLGRRFVAGALDWSALYVISATCMITLFGLGVGVDQERTLGTLLFLAGGLLYAIPEGIWGRSPGKGLLGLALRDQRGQHPELPRVLLRTTVYLTPAVFLSVILKRSPENTVSALAAANLTILSPLLLFVFGRRSGQWTGLHDWLSRTAVVGHRRATTGAAAVPNPHVGMPAHAFPYRLGPYALSVDPAKVAAGCVLEAYDTNLRRRVWIPILSASAPPIPPARRNLCRRGRLRWVNGARSPELSWDAYEAPDGCSLKAAVSARVPWGTVRHWLLHLAQEAQFTLCHEEPPLPLSLDRVWIAAGGDPILLDLNPPGNESGSAGPSAATRQTQGWGEDRALDQASEHAAEMKNAQDFLHEVAVRSLCGPGHPGAGPSGSGHSTPPPLHATRWLQRLVAVQRPSLDETIQSLRVLAQLPPRVDGRRRALQFAGLAVPPMIMVALLALLDLGVMEPLREKRLPGYRQAVFCLDELRDLGQSPERVDLQQRQRDFRVCLAGPLRAVVQDTTADVAGVPVFSLVQRIQIRELLRDVSEPMSSEIETAQLRLAGDLRESRLQWLHRWEMVRDLLILLPILFVLLAPLAVLMGFVLRGGVFLRAMGIAVVTAGDEEASRGRTLLRSLIAWLPLLLIWLLLLGHRWLAAGSPSQTALGPTSTGIAVGLFAVFLAGVAHACKHPARSIQDRLAGTYLVPR